MDAKTRDQLLAGLRRLLARGATIRQAAAELGQPRSTLNDWARARRMRRRRRGLSPAKQHALRQALKTGRSIYRIAADVPVSLETAWRYQQLTTLKRLKMLTGPLPCKPWRCPVGGELLNLSQCILHGTRKPGRTTKRRPPRS